MTRKFLEGLGLEKEVIDKILDQNSADIGSEIGKTNAAKSDLAAAKGELETVRGELEGLKKSTGDAGELQKKLDELQAKYDADTGALQSKLYDRDYSDAIGKAIAGANEGKGLKFSSKSARSAFEAALREKKLELKDGVLTDFDKFVEEQRKADPDAFASDKPTARFSGPVGVGGKPVEGKSRAALAAERYHNNLYGTIQKE